MMADMRGAKLFVYFAGQTTPAPVYADVDLAHQASNPVIADSNGFFRPAYLAPGSYTIRLLSTFDEPLWLCSPCAYAAVHNLAGHFGSQP